MRIVGRSPARAGSVRRAGRRAKPLQHVPVGRVRGDAGARTRRRASGSALRPARPARPSSAAPAAGSEPDPTGRSPSYQSVDRRTAARRCAAASSAGPAGIRVGAPKNSTSTPRADRSRSASRGTTRALAQPLREHVHRRPLAAGQRDDLHAEGLPVREEPLGTGASGLSRSATVVSGQPVARDPGPGVVPVAAVRQGDDHAAGRRPRASPSRSSSSHGERVRRIRRRGHVGSRNASSQYRGVRAQPVADQPSSSASGVGPTTRRRFARSRWTPRPLSRAARSAPAPEQPAARPAGAAP